MKTRHPSQHGITARINTHRLRPTVIAACLALFSAAGAIADGLGDHCYPLPHIRSRLDLQARQMNGVGSWLAGLPGHAAYNGSHVHAGMDLRAGQGEAVYAVAAGVVDPMSDAPHGGYGANWTKGGVIIIRSHTSEGAPYLIVYGHTQNHSVRGGQTVRAGEMIGEVGPWLPLQGGPHLHLTVRLGELPRYGWGTPTLIGYPFRDGAEVVVCEDDVFRLGYVDPLDLWP